MKRAFLITFFILLFSTLAYAETDVISIGDFGEVTFDDAKIAGEIAPLSDNYAETENYYDQLTEAEKLYYNDIEKNIMSFTDGTATYTYTIKDEVQIRPELTSSKDMFADAWDSLGVDSATFIFRPLYSLMYMDKPQYFWIEMNNLTVKYGAKSYVPSTGILKGFYIKYTIKKGFNSCLPDCYENQEQVLTDYDALMAKANEIVNSVPEKSSEWGKLNYYMNWLRDNCAYNSNLKTASRHAYLPTSALLYGKDGVNSPVCEGYCEALKILCNLSGIKSMCTESYYIDSSGNETGHKWSLVNLGGKFYHCDPTWFDIVGISAYNYLLTGSENMSIYDSTQNHTIVYQMKFLAPEISQSDYLNDIGINGWRVLNADGNNKIDTSDTAAFIKKLSGILTGSPSDVNNDGNTDITDAVVMQKLMFE